MFIWEASDVFWRGDKPPSFTPMIGIRTNYTLPNVFRNSKKKKKVFVRVRRPSKIKRTLYLIKHVRKVCIDSRNDVAISMGFARWNDNDARVENLNIRRYTGDSTFGQRQCVFIGEDEPARSWRTIELHNRRSGVRHFKTALLFFVRRKSKTIRFPTAAITERPRYRYGPVCGHDPV